MNSPHDPEFFRTWASYAPYEAQLPRMIAGMERLASAMERLADVLEARRDAQDAPAPREPHGPNDGPA